MDLIQEMIDNHSDSIYIAHESGLKAIMQRLEDQLNFRDVRHKLPKHIVIRLIGDERELCKLETTRYTKENDGANDMPFEPSPLKSDKLIGLKRKKKTYFNQRQKDLHDEFTAHSQNYKDYLVWRQQHLLAKTRRTKSAPIKKGDPMILQKKLTRRNSKKKIIKRRHSYDQRLATKVMQNFKYGLKLDLNKQMKKSLQDFQFLGSKKTHTQQHINQADLHANVAEKKI